MAEHREDFEDKEAGEWGYTTFRVLKCRGCDAVYVQRESFSTEGREYGSETEISFWPAPVKRMRPGWTIQLAFEDFNLYNLFRDIYTAFDNDLLVLAAIGLRTAFDRASELLKVDPAKTFAQKLSELCALGKIGVDEKETLNILTDAGGAAAHRGWKPSSEDLNTMMSIIEHFLYQSFVLPHQGEKLKRGVPPKPTRRSS